jgi:hypothetical protein
VQERAVDQMLVATEPAARQGAVIDEAQHAPELFAEMQGVLGAAGRMGMFVLTGSQNQSLLSRVTHSLAGRKALHFWRDNIGTEVDVVLERGSQIAAIEIKSGPTAAYDAFGALAEWRKYATEPGHFDAIHPALVYGGDTRFTRDGVDVMPWPGL